MEDTLSLDRFHDFLAPNYLLTRKLFTGYRRIVLKLRDLRQSGGQKRVSAFARPRPRKQFCSVQLIGPATKPTKRPADWFVGRSRACHLSFGGAAVSFTDVSLPDSESAEVGQTSASFRLQKLMEVVETSAVARSYRRQCEPTCGCLELGSLSRPRRACPERKSSHAH